MTYIKVAEKKSGGARKGAGRKPLPPEERRVAITVYVKPQYAAELRAGINKLLEKIKKTRR